MKQASKSGGTTVTYNFDALGRRIQRTSSVGGTTKFVYDGADVIRDLDVSGSTVADYLNGPGVDNKLRQTVGVTASYFVTDHLGTTRAFTDSSGNVSSSLTYDSYGNVTSGSGGTRYTFTGRESDSDTGLMFYRARWYDPQQGRFISEDPIGFAGGANWYGYVGNNPLLSKDPSGLCPQNTSDNPLSVDSPPSVDCNISVAFSGSYDIGKPNGAGEFSYGPYGQVHGLGFTVYGSVANGGIGQIGADVNKNNPNGSWAIQQFTSAYSVINGNVEKAGGNAIPDFNTKSPYEITGNQFRWYDHPGVTTRGLQSYQGKFDITVKAVTDNKHCEARFHALMTFSNGSWSVTWGSGGFPR